MPAVIAWARIVPPARIPTDWRKPPSRRPGFDLFLTRLAEYAEPMPPWHCIHAELRLAPYDYASDDTGDGNRRRIPLEDSCLDGR
jgi:hypothetical protein